ncbi:MAG: hypothetical protein U1F33_03080 [Alphaproteobacteria bacterium]
MTSGRAAVLLVAAALVGLSGCTETKAPCPHVKVPAVLSQLTKFEDGAAQDASNVRYQSRISNVAIACTSTEAKTAQLPRGSSGSVDNLEVQVRINFATLRGPRGQGDVANATYFVAVTDIRDTILDRQEFPVKLKMGPGGQATTLEDAWMLIKLDGRSGAAFRIYTGFQLSPGELEFNKKMLEN